MEPDLHQAISQFLIRYPYAVEKGKRTEKATLSDLPRRIRNRIPGWYQTLLMEFPLAGLNGGIPDDFGQDQYIGKPVHQLPMMDIMFYSVPEMVSEMEDAFPGNVLQRKKWIPFALDNESTYGPIFMDGSRNNPPVRLFLHDSGESFKELLEASELLCNSFSDIFTLGKLPNRYIELTSENREKAIPEIEKVFAMAEEIFRSPQNTQYINLQSLTSIHQVLENKKDQFSLGNHLSIMMKLEWSLYDLEIEIPTPFLEQMRDVFLVSNLHLPESPLLIDYW